MNSFKDANGRDWELRFTYAQLQRVKEKLGLDLLNLTEGPKEVYRLRFNIPVLVNLLYFCLDAKNQGIDEEAFFAGFDGDTFDPAYEALQQEYVDFFPKSQRPAMSQTLGKMKETTEQALMIALEEINGETMTKAMQTTMDELRDSIRGNIATALKESQA